MHKKTIDLRCQALTLLALAFPLFAAAVPRGEAGQKPAARDTRPNIIVIMADDLGWQDVALPFADQETMLNRRYRTPNLIKMAAEGMKFTNAYAAGPVCSPTRVALITGRTPAETRVTAALDRRDQGTYGNASWPGLLPPAWNLNGLSPTPGTPRSFTGTTLLPRLLRDAGYRTIHVGKGHWGAIDTPGEDPLALGFDVNIGGSGAGHPSAYYGQLNFASRRDPATDVPGLDKYHGSETFLTEALTIEANRAIDQAVASGKPFFLHFAHFAVHTPLNMDFRFQSNYSASGLEPMEVAYAALVEGLDKSLGDVLANIDRHGLNDSTFVVFVSDNGASPESRTRPVNAHNAPLRAQKGSGYEGGLRVPLVVRWPGRIKGNTTNATPVITDDLFPTLLSLARVPDRERISSGIRGRDLSDTLTGEKTLDTDRVLFWHFPHGSGRGVGYPNEPFSAVRQGPWKLIFLYGSRRYELYDLSNDLSESQNLVATNPKVAGQLASLLRKSLTDARAQLPLDATTGREVELPPSIPDRQ